MAAGRERTASARLAAQSGGRHKVVTYGRYSTSKLEIFSGSEGVRPTFLMFHGGWWQEGSIDDGGRYATTLVPLGATHIAVGYPLTPNVTLSNIVDEAIHAIEYVIEHADTLGCDLSKLVVGGHSAGAQLAAMLVTSRAPARVRDAISGLFLVGGAFDLAPVALSYVNDLVGMSLDEAHELSPINYQPSRRAPVLIRVGEREPSEFHRQSKLLAERWAGEASVSLSVVAGRDHFDILEELDTPGGALLGDVTNLLQIG
jgi:arylformamidase